MPWQDNLEPAKAADATMGGAVPRCLLPIAAAISVSSGLTLFSSAMALVGGSCLDGGLGLSMIQYYTTIQHSVRGRNLQYSSQQELTIDQSCRGWDLDQIINGPRGAVGSVHDKFEVFYIDLVTKEWFLTVTYVLQTRQHPLLLLLRLVKLGGPVLQQVTSCGLILCPPIQKLELIKVLSADGALAASSLFKIIVESHLKAAADSAFEDNDNVEYFHVSVSKRDEQLALYALIAQAAADTTIPLSNCFLSDLRG